MPHDCLHVDSRREQWWNSGVIGIVVFAAEQKTIAILITISVANFERCFLLDSCSFLPSSPLLTPNFLNTTVLQFRLLFPRRISPLREKDPRIISQ